MAWEVEGTDEFAGWFEALSQGEMADVIAMVDLLVERGPRLGHPFTSGVVQSRHPHMRELRIQHAGRPYRVLYAFDPRRTASSSWAATREASIDGTTSTFHERTGCTTRTWTRSEGRG
jgi:hypothetical protein